MSKTRKAFLLLLFIAVYFNVGYGFYWYIEHNVCGQEQLTLFGKIFFSCISQGSNVCTESAGIIDILGTIMFWPILVFFSLVYWFFYFLFGGVFKVIIGA